MVKKLPIFVENSVKTIREGHFTFTKYCPTKDNPGDMLTRGLAHNEYLNHSVLWLKGPPWLPKGDWPICELFDSACEIDNNMPTSTTYQNQICGISSIINIKISIHWADYYVSPAIYCASLDVKNLHCAIRFILVFPN